METNKNKKIDMSKGIMRLEWFEKTYHSYAKLSQVRSFFNEKCYTVKDNDETTYRLVNHWTELGLLDGRNEGGWKRFTLTEIVWQRVIASLRLFGMANEKILKTKSSILANPMFGKDLPSLLEFYISVAVVKSMAVEILVFSDGSADIGTKDEVLNSQRVGYPTENFIMINLNSLIQPIFTQKVIEQNFSYFPLNKEEKKLYDDINSFNFDQIHISIGKDGNIMKTTKRKTFDKKKKIIEIVHEAEDQDIYIKVRGKRIVGANQIIQEKTEPKKA